MPQRLVVYLPVLPGEEPWAEPTLRLIGARSVEASEVVLLRIGVAGPAPSARVAGDWRPLRVVDAEPDPRGAVYQALGVAAGAHDVLLIRPGAVPPAAWDARLRLAAYAAPNVGTASPLSVAGLGVRAARRADARTIDRHVYARSRCAIVEIDRFDPMCFYLRHDALAALSPDITAYDAAAGDFGEYLARRILFHGYCHALADHLFVAGREKVSGTIFRSGPSGAERRDLAALAQTVRDALSSVSPAPAIPGVDQRPVELHVTTNWGGGVTRWLQDYSRADPERENLVLRPIGTPGCFGEGLALYRHVDDYKPLRQWRLDPPIPFTAIAHLQYRAILDEVMETYGVAAVLVSSLIGHSLDALCLDAPTVIACHDYYPFCPALNIHFREVCTQCDRARLAHCLAENPFTQLFRRAEPDYWVGLRERFAELVCGRRIPMAAPSTSVVRGLLALEPRLAGADCRVLPHGIQQERFQPVGPPDRRGKKLQAVILGRMTPEKGAELLWDSLDELLRTCDVTLLGCGHPGRRFSGRPGVRLVTRYEPTELPKLLGELAPDFGLLLSILPETFSYTLSELRCAGIPPLATRLGSFADRIDHGATGFLFEPRKDDLLRTVALVLDEPARLAAVRENLRGLRHRTLAEMLADYDRLLPAPPFCERLYVAARRSPPAAALPARQASPDEPPGGPWDRIVSEETFEDLLDQVYEVFRRKLAHTPRLANWQRPLVEWAVAGGYRLVKLGQRLGRRRPPPDRKAA